MLLLTQCGHFISFVSCSVPVKLEYGQVQPTSTIINSGMTYYLTLWYPASRIAHRIGWYFTAAQLSAAVVGLVSAGFQKMNRDGGLTGYAWYRPQKPV
jgi:hypothetical protein